MAVAEPNRLRYDGVETFLNSELQPTSTVIEFSNPDYATNTLTHAGGELVGTIVPNVEYLPLSILDDNYRLSEIVWLVDFTEGATTGTIVRGKEFTRPQTHPAGRKVVQAATVADFALIQDHIRDPNPHPELLAQVEQMIADAIATHNQSPKPEVHPILAPLDEPTFTGTSTFADIDVAGILEVLDGASIVVNSDGSVTIDGTLHITGKQVFVSNTLPVDPDVNTVWIRTFGG